MDVSDLQIICAGSFDLAVVMSILLALKNLGILAKYGGHRPVFAVLINAHNINLLQCMVIQ